MKFNTLIIKTHPLNKKEKEKRKNIYLSYCKKYRRIVWWKGVVVY
jgi:hypothetical protein